MRATLALLTATCLMTAHAGAAPQSAETPAREGDEVVVLLHGLFRSTRSMRSVEAFLSEAGYRVVNLGYPSREQPIEALADGLAEKLRGCCAAPGVPLHFVTHSLGGIVLRHLLATRPPPELGRVVMLSPPNGGSELVDSLHGRPLFRRALGPAGPQLGTDEDSVPLALGPVGYEVGIIAGNRSLNPIGSWLIPGPDDGTVSVESTRVEGMADFLVVPHGHTHIMRSPLVMWQTLHFLRTGRFEHGDLSRTSPSPADAPAQARTPKRFPDS